MDGRVCLRNGQYHSASARPCANDIHRGLPSQSHYGGFPEERAWRVGHKNGHAAPRGRRETPPELGLQIERVVAAVFKLNEARNRPLGDFKVVRISFDANARVSSSLGGRKG